MKFKELFVMVMAAACVGASTLEAKCVVGLVSTCPATAETQLVPEAYLQAFAGVGAQTQVLAWTDDVKAISNAVAACDLVVMCGGEDVDPARYKAARSPRLGAVNLSRDAFEFAVLDAATAQRKRIFGICRGQQIINVYFGGTLWQDLPSEFPVKGICHRRRDLPKDGVHALTVEPGSFLAEVYGEEPLSVNSLHHQAVKDLAPGFKIVARAPDGVVEAIENPARGVSAVQFHPERMVINDSMWSRLFRSLLKPTEKVEGR